MMKRRIVEKIHGDSTSTYYAQFRLLGLWWYNQVLVGWGSPDLQRAEFATKEIAQAYTDSYTNRQIVERRLHYDTCPLELYAPRASRDE